MSSSPCDSEFSAAPVLPIAERSTAVRAPMTTYSADVLAWVGADALPTMGKSRIEAMAPIATSSLLELTDTSCCRGRRMG